ncbi:MAG: peptidoglycan DD-metalloendopeptidase family protein, partial [Gammaproteobacteria bacterium]|nr:peptidoglycan DD-metalloendopeptidase family protein [Gammaproteobacteria bacterium]
RTARIQTVTAHLDELDTVEAAITRHTSALGRLRASEQDEQRTLEASRRARRQVLAALDAEIHNKGQELERLQRNARALQKLIDSLRRAPANVPAGGARTPFAALKGRLPWPANGRVLARYGQPREVGVLKWQGVLIAAPLGGPVRAVWYGRVVFADWLRGLGLLVIVDHGHGYMSLYAHNQNLYVKTGDRVQPGRVIAAVGDSGGARRPALYFEIRDRGRPVNPFRWCRGTPAEVTGLSR